MPEFIDGPPRRTAIWGLMAAESPRAPHVGTPGRGWLV